VLAVRGREELVTWAERERGDIRAKLEEEGRAAALMEESDGEKTRETEREAEVAAETMVEPAEEAERRTAEPAAEAEEAAARPP
jgi:hypothetical protein